MFDKTSPGIKHRKTGVSRQPHELTVSQVLSIIHLSEKYTKLLKTFLILYSDK